MAVEDISKDLHGARMHALRQQAAAVAKHAYAPYSHFRVGAAVLLSNGHTVTGCNVENASYRLTVCAEQAAIACAIARYGAEVRIVAVAVANADATIACQPCGACRQTIAEFADGSCIILFPGADGADDGCTLHDMLPATFVLKNEP